MNSLEAKLPGKGVLLMLSALLGIAALLVLVSRWSAERGALESERAKETLALQAMRSTSDALADVRREIEVMKRDLVRRELEEKRLAEQLIAISPDSRWTSAPTHPGWDDSSPYVWLSKESARLLPVRAFRDDGRLVPEIVSVLTLKPAQAASLNRALEGILTEYRALEVAQAETVEEPLAGINVQEPHLTLRVRPFPKEGAELKERFEATLREGLGPERAQLVLATSEGWLNSHFALAADEPKIISVVRHEDGTYNLSIGTGKSWFSTAGFTDLSTYLPPHLLPFFSESALRPGAAEPQASQ